jgi:hypothetical protein
LNAYLFSAGVTQTRLVSSGGYRGAAEALQTWDSCVSAIVYGGDVEQAQAAFEAWCRPPPESDKPGTSEIKRLVGAQFIDQVLTESGGKPPDWPDLARQNTETVETTAVDDFEQGYWVDANQLVPPDRISPDVETLKRDLPEDVRSGLNWSPEKGFLYLVSVLSQPPPVPAESDDEFELDAANPDDGEEESRENTAPDLDPAVASLPEMRDKEAAALVEARNAVVAAWLWRRFAAGTRLASNELQIGPLCNLFPAG